METKLIIDGEEHDITDDVRWKEKFGTPLPTVRQYSRISECGSFWAWLSYSWNFINAAGYREVGRRFLGRETIYYFVVPRGELRF